VESQINKINMFITSIKESGLLKGRLNILFEKSKGYFHADESIVSEYINALTSEADFDVTSIYVDKEYFNSPNEIQITDAASKISSTQIYITPGEYGRKKDTQEKQPVNKNNIYSRPSLSNDYTEPRNDTEKKLVEIWQVMFGIDKVGIEDNFIELGGDSLMATKIITRINQELNILVKLPVFFQNPTIEAIAGNITSNKNILNKLTSELEISKGEREEGEI